MGFPCRKCPDTTSGVALAAVMAIAAVVAVAVLTSYLISGENVHGRRGGKIERLARYVPLQSLKIVIVTWQILTQVWRELEIVVPRIVPHNGCTHPGSRLYGSHA